MKANQTDIIEFALYVLDIIDELTKAERGAVSDDLLNNMSELTEYPSLPRLPLFSRNDTFFPSILKNLHEMALRHASHGFWKAHMKSKTVATDINDMRLKLDLAFRKFNVSLFFYVWLSNIIDCYVRICCFSSRALFPHPNIIMLRCSGVQELREYTTRKTANWTVS